MTLKKHCSRSQQCAWWFSLMLTSGLYWVRCDLRASVCSCVFSSVWAWVYLHTHRSIKQQHSEKSKILIQKFLNINKNFTWNLSFFFLSHLQNSLDWHPWLCCCCYIDWDNFHFRDYHWLHSMWLWQWAAWCTGASSWTPALHGVQVVNEDRWHGIYIRW